MQHSDRSRCDDRSDKAPPAGAPRRLPSAASAAPSAGLGAAPRLPGNHGMQRLLSAAAAQRSGPQRVLQAKLALGTVDDPLEREADRVAEQALAAPGPGAVADGMPPLVRRREAPMAAREGGVPASVERTLAGPGDALSPPLRHDMEQRFGHDFSQVRIHLGAAAEQSARDVDAQAYTVDRHVVFGAGRFAPGTQAGQRLLAHELAHVVQQGAGTLRRRYRLPELQGAVTGVGTGPMVNGTPAALFYPGSAANTTNRKALVVAGIHGTEASAIALGNEAASELGSGALVPDFHTLLVPRANPGSSRGTSNVPDLNREYGGTVASAEPIAGQLQAMATEFEPERILSIHAISTTALGGLFLDPIRSPGTTPAALTNAQQRADAYTHDARNQAAMTLTEGLVDSVRMSGATGAASATPGNTAGSLPIGSGPTSFPASRYPGSGAGASPYNLVYPEQNQVRSGPHGETSLGVWAAQLPFAPAVITLEVPGYAASPGGTNWRPFLPAVRRFLRLPAAAPATPAPAMPAPSTTPGSSTVPGTTLQRAPLSEADLAPQRGIPLAFMQEVYRRQVAIWTARGASYVHEVPGTDRVSLASGDVIAGRSVSVHRDIAAAVHNLLVDARADLTAAGSAAGDVDRLAVRSGYRSAGEQFSIWEHELARYYRDTFKARAALTGGEHGTAAAQHLADYINQRVFSPGYSPHQRGRTIDFSYRSAAEWPGAGHWAEADSSASGIATWTASWFYRWLRSHAGRYGFAENPAIREPWHWEWSPPRIGLRERLLRLLARLWRLLLRMLGRPVPPGDEGDEDTEPPAPAADDDAGAADRKPPR